MKTVALITAIILTIISSDMFAQASYALLFDGVNDYVSIPHSDNFNVSKVTIEMWFYWNNTTVPADVDFLIGKDLEELEIHTGGASGNNGLRFIPTDQLYFDTEKNVFETQSWNHVAFVYDPSLSLYKCYINGVEKNLTKGGTNPVTWPITTSLEALKIGSRIGGWSTFQGKIKEVRIWNVVRTVEDINANMNIELSGYHEGLVAYYKMSDGSGFNLTDNSGNGHTGILINGPEWVEQVILPVELLSFNSQVNGSVVTLKWNTATEVNNYGFEIQKSVRKSGVSTDDWQAVGFVPGHGNSNSVKEYSFTEDLLPSGIVSYRLKQIDNNGQFTLSETIRVEANSIEDYQLMQNSPNPFNPTTSIKFQVPATSFVTLKIYDQLGREVITLLNEVKSAGSHVIYWNGKNSNGQAVSSGVYFYSFSSGNHFETRKMNLLK